MHRGRARPSAQGRALLSRVIQLGRAFNATVLVATQRVADLGDLADLFGVCLLFGQETGAEARAGLVQVGAVTAKTLAKGAVRAKAISRRRQLAQARRRRGQPARSRQGGGDGPLTRPQRGHLCGHRTGLGLRRRARVDLDQSDADRRHRRSRRQPRVDRGQQRSRPLRSGRVLLGTGFLFTNPGNRQVTWLEATPFLSPSTGSGVKGRFASNSGGSATGQIMAICLR